MRPLPAALLDAMLQQPARRLVLEWEVVAPLERLQRGRGRGAPLAEVLAAPSLED